MIKKLNPIGKERIIEIERKWKDFKKTSFGMIIFELLDELKRIKKIKK